MAIHNANKLENSSRKAREKMPASFDIFLKNGIPTVMGDFTVARLQNVPAGMSQLLLAFRVDHNGYP